MSSKKYTQYLWEKIAPIYQATLDHPFMAGLIDGTLPEDVFRQYAVQDAIYLQAYARSLSLASARAPKDEWCEMFAEHARGILVDERSLHETFFGGWGMTPEDVYSTEPLPTTAAYNAYLLSIAGNRPFEEIVGVVLPCYWIYYEVGKELGRKGSSNPLYQQWIATYEDEAFGDVVRSVIDVLDDVSDGLPEDRLTLIERHFVMTSRYEYMFWDAAWQRETWPVGPR